MPINVQVEKIYWMYLLKVNVQICYSKYYYSMSQKNENIVVFLSKSLKCVDIVDCFPVSQFWFSMTIIYLRSR